VVSALAVAQLIFKGQIAMQRRQFLKTSVLLSAAGIVGPAVASQTVQNSARRTGDAPSFCPVANL